MQFCGNNVVVVRCILLEMHFVVIIMVIISYVLKIEQEGGRRLCENTKGGHEQKTVEKHSVAYAENFHGERFVQWHRVVICIWCALFVTSEFDVIVLFPNQRFSEVR